VNLPDRLIPEGDGHTALTDEERTGLLLSYVTTRADLNDAEQRNIAAALVRRRPPTFDRLLDDRYLRELHRAMFGEVWRWAGRYRLRETNIGVDPAQISVHVRDLVEDARTWVAQSTFEHDELAVRFHHRLVAIHPFPNGNGRQSRVAADYLVRALGQPAFSWGAENVTTTAELRASYLSALRAADAGELGRLIEFARS
jgi:Fic-DOC domain mobile mystery protein B